MLERICITRDTTLDAARPLNIGEIAESMLYYGNVRVIVDEAGLNQLIRDIPYNDLLRALSQGFLEVTYVKSMMAIHTENTGTENELHRPVAISIPSIQFPDLLDKAFQLTGLSLDRAQSRRRAISRYFEKSNIDARAIDAVKADIENSKFLERVVPTILRGLTKTGPPQTDVEFYVRKSGEFYVVDSNIEFEKLRVGSTNGAATESPESKMAQLLVKLAKAREVLSWSSIYDADLKSDSESEMILEAQLNPVLARSVHNEQQISTLTSTTLEGRNISDAVNSGRRTFGEVLDLLAAAAQFKNWISGRANDAILLADYVAEIDRISWIESVPTKSLRWVLLLAGGTTMAVTGEPLIAATITTAVLTGFDQLLVERLFRGWRPNQFVHRHLSPFVDPEE